MQKGKLLAPIPFAKPLHLSTKNTQEEAKAGLILMGS